MATKRTKAENAQRQAGYLEKKSEGLPEADKQDDSEEERFQSGLIPNSLPRCWPCTLDMRMVSQVWDQSPSRPDPDC